MLNRKKLLTAVCLMTVSMGALSVHAYANTYDARTDNVDQKLMFPGDVLFGADQLLIGEDAQPAVVGPEGEYCFNDGVVYRANRDPESGSIILLPFGRTVSVENGISNCEDLFEDTHYIDSPGNAGQESYFVTEDETDERDLAAYPEGMTVRISAGTGTDGEVFDHWECSDDIVIDDSFSPDTVFVMGQGSVSVKAVFVEESDAFYDADADEAGEVPGDGSEEYWPESEEGGEDDFWSEDDDEEDNFWSEDEEEDAPWSDEAEEEENPWADEAEEEEDPWSEDDDEEDDVWPEGDDVNRFMEEDEEPLQIEQGWDNGEDAGMFDIAGSDEGSDSIFDHLDPDALNNEAGAELDEYIENQASVIATPLSAASPDQGEQPLPDAAQQSQPQEEQSLPEQPPEEQSPEEQPEAAPSEETVEIPEVEKVQTPDPEEASAAAPDADTGLLPAENAEPAPAEAVPPTPEELEAMQPVPDEDEEPILPDNEEKESEKQYRIRIVSEHVYVYGDVIVNEENQIRAGKDAVVNLQADTLEDADFDHWVITRKSDDSEVEAEDAYSPETTFVMPSGSVYVSAVYKDRVVETHEVNVTLGSGSGTYEPGDTVTLIAREALPGEQFKTWQVTQGDVTLSDKNAGKTTFVMGSEDVAVRAVYEYIYYNLKVTSGSGSGSYKKEDVVTLTAQWPADGKVFDTWLVNSANASVAEAGRFTTTLTMPADHVSVQALYKNGPAVSDNLINGISSDQTIMRGETFTFSASGAGMNNAAPNPGDYWWKPSGYRIGSASGSFTDDRYSASMAVNAIGNYTLYVDFRKEVWNGTSWESNGATDTRSVSFTVTAPNAVQTGDDTPILPYVLAAGAALILIIILIVLRSRRKK